MLWIFHLFELDIVVGIVFQMIRDVLLWVGLYWIVLVVFSMLFMGTSDLDTIINMEFVFVYVLICPMFQSLGEFNLYQMTNTYNIIIICLMY
jgi:hypothetical protein